MASTIGGNYQRYLAMSIRAEASARGWALNELAARAGIDYQTLLRKLNLKRNFLISEVGQVADALGMRMSEMFADAERRADREPQEPAEMIDSSDKLTRRQREQAKSALTGDPRITPMAGRRTRDEPLGSPERHPRGADAG